MYQEVIDTAKEKMQKTTSVFQEELRSIRAGRANPRLLDRVMVDYYGTPTPLPQMGNVTSPSRGWLLVNVGIRRRCRWWKRRF
jgi:ribosome recycling factor